MCSGGNRCRDAPMQDGNGESPQTQGQIVVLQGK
jgi:hypothetical protein